MATLLITHEDCLQHQPGKMHPESPWRLRAVLGALESDRFGALDRRAAPLGGLADIGLVHPVNDARELLRAIPDEGSRALDADTVVSPGSGHAALRAVGAAVSAVDAVMNGEVANAFCAVRPPGHHAEPSRPMGFCLFNTAAIAARHAQAAFGISRVAIVDFDVHHGNGSQTVAEHDASIFYASSHQYPFYPGTGGASERGLGNIANAPLPAGSGSKAFRDAYQRIILPALDAFQPELVIVSAGFDAHGDDPLAQLELDEQDFAWVTAELLALASRHAHGRLVSVLEGGYDLAALARSAAAHVEALMQA